MTQLDDYTDVRELHEDYEQRICPECGTQEWFKHFERKRWRTDQWNCQNCGSYYEDVLEHPCPSCDIRMVVNDNCFVCRNENCEWDRSQFDRQMALDRLSSNDYPKHAHKPGVLMGECPLCGNSTSVNGGPDGELKCDECGDFHAGQYQDSWFCYSIWMQRPGIIRVNEI